MAAEGAAPRGIKCCYSSTQPAGSGDTATSLEEEGEKKGRREMGERKVAEKRRQRMEAGESKDGEK